MMKNHNIKGTRKRNRYMRAAVKKTMSMRAKMISSEFQNKKIHQKTYTISSKLSPE